jgi:hypothetical protein
LINFHSSGTLPVVGYKVKDGGRKLEIFVDVSGDFRHKDLTEEIHQEYDSETRKSKNDDTTTYISVENFIFQINQNNLSGTHIQVNGGVLVSGDSNNMPGDTYNVVQASAVGKYARSDQNTFINSGQKQDLAEAAVEIQKLLDQLAETYPNITETTLAQAIQVEIQHNPTLKVRLINALKSGGVEALKAIFNHPFVSVPVETIKGFLEAEAE